MQLSIDIMHAGCFFFKHMIQNAEASLYLNDQDRLKRLPEKANTSLVQFAFHHLKFKHTRAASIGGKQSDDEV
jgi:hypothetical protein